MSDTQQRQRKQARCTLCPACCQVDLVQAGPDSWRSEYPISSGQGLCPRGSVLGELISHRRRILSPSRRTDGSLRQVDMNQALREVIDAASGGAVTIILDANVPTEQMVEAARWCQAWPGAKLSFAIEPSERQMLLGIEASGADYIAPESLAECDGFLIIGGVIAANPTCARGIFDRRKAQPRTPIVVIDPAAGKAVKFATHPVAAPVGRELEALAAVVAAAGVSVEAPKAAAWEDIPSAAAAGEAIRGCKRLGVLIAAEYGRSACWRQIGYLAGQLAKALTGGVAPQTSGANALAALRLGEKLGAVSLAAAMSDEAGLRIVVGCDVVGMLGLESTDIFAAAASLPNRTTEQARVVLPLAMTAETAGSYLTAGNRLVEVSELLPPPAGVLSAGEIVAALASAAGVAGPGDVVEVDLNKPLAADKPAPAPVATAEMPKPSLVLGREAIHAGCGDLTAYGSWQNQIQPLPELRISPQDAREMKLKNLAEVTVQAGGKSLQARLRTAAELTAGVMVLPESLPQTRAMLAGVIDRGSDTIVTSPVAVEISSRDGNSDV